MYYVTTINGKRIYKLTEFECVQFGRSIPTFVYWNDDFVIGNMNMTENEASSVAELIKRGV